MDQKEVIARERAIKQIVHAAYVVLGRHVVNYPLPKAIIGGRIQFDPYFADKQPTAEQVEQISKSSLGNQVKGLITAVARKYGIKEANGTAAAACAFFRASGMIYRCRARHEYAERLTSKKKGIAARGTVLPPRLVLWEPPAFSRSGIIITEFGWNSLECLDRDGLIGVAVDFFALGIRCTWFEKMIVESLVAAETYATLLLVQRQLLIGSNESGKFLQPWFYDWITAKTKADHPALYPMAIGVGMYGWRIVRFLACVALAWWAYSKHEERPQDWLPIVWTVLFGLIVIGKLARWLLQKIVGWAREDSPLQILQDSASGKLGMSLLTAHFTATARDMAPSAVKQAIFNALRRDALIDPIAVAYLDRAAAANEHLWTDFRGYGETPTDVIYEGDIEPALEG